MFSTSLCKPSEQIALCITEFGRHCNHNLRTQVSSASVATTLIEMRHTSTLQQKLSTLLHARWNYKIFVTIKGAQHQMCSKCSLSNRDHNISHLLNQLPFSVGRNRKVAPLPHAQFASYLEASRARLPLNARERRDRWSRWLRAVVFLATLGGGSWVLWESGQALARF